MPLGRYELPRRSGDAHLYRIGHPLAEWASNLAKSRSLTVERMVFDYEAYGTQVSTLKNYRGMNGWLSVSLISVEALGQHEEHVVVSACTDTGVMLREDDPEKLLRLPATQTSPGLFSAAPGDLAEDERRKKNDLLRQVGERNLGYFEQEVRKLDAWADDLKIGLETEIKEIDREIKEVRRTAATAPTLDEKLHWQKRQRELEGNRNRLRRKLFDRQDEVEAKRNEVITQLEGRLTQEVRERLLFTVEWELT